MAKRKRHKPATQKTRERVNGVPVVPLRVEIHTILNDAWKTFNDENLITLEQHSYLRQDSKIFTIGSCFAVEIRAALHEAGLDVYPKYRDISVDRSKCLIGNLPDRDNINHYHTFAIRQEFDKYHGNWKQEAEDYWLIDDRFWNSGRKIYQDPYRRSVMALTQTDLMNAIGVLDEVIRDGMKNADVFLITLGLIEVWRKKNNGLFACEHPGYNGGGGHQETEFYLSTFQENYENAKETIRLIRDINRDANIVLTVSPVWLGRTFTGSDIYVANLESKSVLRAVAGQVCREEDGVHYFPSYEIANALLGEGHAPDGRHVQQQTVFDITNAYMFAHSAGTVMRR